MGALQLRRDTDAVRKTIVLAQGEPFYVTDRKQLWVGDGVTLGGNYSGSIEYETPLGDIFAGLISKSEHGIDKPSSVTVLNPYRVAVDIYYEIRENDDIYIASTVSLYSHILKIF